MPSRYSIIIAFAVLLAGCVTPSQKEVETDVDKATAESLPQVSEAWRAAGAAGPVQVGWIDAFNDDVLSKLVAEAQANNQNLAAAAAGVEQARALARQAGASLTPDINLDIGANRRGQLDSDASGPATSLNAGVSVSWEADVWGRVRSGVAQAQASAQAAEADYRFAQYSVAANTAIAYFTAIEANLQTGIARDSLDVLERTNRIVQAQYNEGVAVSPGPGTLEIGPCRSQRASGEPGGRFEKRAAGA